MPSALPLFRSSLHNAPQSQTSLRSDSCSIVHTRESCVLLSRESFARALVTCNSLRCPVTVLYFVSIPVFFFVLLTHTHTHTHTLSHTQAARPVNYAIDSESDEEEDDDDAPIALPRARKKKGAAGEGKKRRLRRGSDDDDSDECVDFMIL